MQVVAEMALVAPRPGKLRLIVVKIAGLFVPIPIVPPQKTPVTVPKIAEQMYATIRSVVLPRVKINALARVTVG